MRHAPELEASVLDAEQLVPETQLGDKYSFNFMLKHPEFWQQMPHDPLLIIQTDALVSRPLDPFSFNSLLGITIFT